MSTSPTENPGPEVVILTALGDAVLDHLAASLAAECDDSPTSIADLLERVLEADMQDLAESLSEAARAPVRDSCPSRDVEEIGPAAESPDGQDGPARRRLAAVTARRQDGRRSWQRHHPLSAYTGRYTWLTCNKGYASS